MIEQGLVQLIQAGLGSPPICPGGFLMELPKDFINPAQPMAWTYHAITSEPLYTLQDQDPYTRLDIQINAHGYTAANAVSLARAIDSVLRGLWRGTLPDGTVVYAITRKPGFLDGFSDAARSFVRSLEYTVQYHQV